MNLVRYALGRPLTIVVIVIAVIIGAGVALHRMARDIFPPLGLPTIYVAQPYGGMDPAQMEGYLTYYYEYHFLYITGIEHVESKSIQGASIMKLQFHAGTDMAAALAETVAYVNRARAMMPPGTPGPFVTRFDAGSVPVGYLVFSTDNPTRTVGQIQDAALNLVRPLFATLAGVSAPPPFGGSARTIVVNVKPERMQAYRLSPEQIVEALALANTLSPSGNMNLEDRYPIVPSNAVVKNIKDLESTPLRTGDHGSVFLRDVASVEDAADLVTSYALVNGKRTVYIPVTKRADASTLSVVSLVKANLQKFQSVLPDDVKVSYEFDQSPVVWRAIKSLATEGLLGAVLTSLMVLVFLRNWRSAAIVAINIPLSLCAASVALWLTGATINLMTLSGLALAIGILVDEATVTIESIHTHLAQGKTIGRAAYDATTETAAPRLLAILCIVAVFLPAFFMTGAAQSLFAPLALAVGFSMVGSYLLSSTLVPILAVWLMQSDSRPEPHTAVSSQRSFAHLRGRYERLLQRICSGAGIVVSIYIVSAVAIVAVCASRIGSEIFPKTDSGELALRLHAPVGTRVENTEALALQVLDLIAEAAGREHIALTMGLIGVHAANYPVNLIHLWNAGPEDGWLAVKLKPDSGIRVSELQERLRQLFAARLPQVHFSFEPSDIVNRVMSFGASTPIEVAVNGPNLAVSREHAEKLYDALRGIPALRDVQYAQPLDFPTVEVNINRERAGLLGVNVRDVTRSLVAATTSSRFTVPNYWADANSGVAYSLQVQIPQAQTRSIEDLKNVPVGGTAGSTVLLRNVASVTPGTAVGEYERYNMARVVSITANVEGAALGEVAKQIDAAIAKVGDAPAKTSVAVRGQIVPLHEVLSGFRGGLAMSVVIIFLLLAANFQSVRLSLVVVSTVPAVLAGVTFTLWITGTTLNVQSAIGAIMAVGVAVANAILLVTFAERSRLESHDSVSAAMAGATNRLRPILMTSCAMLGGMLPLAVGLGESGDQTAPLGRAVMGGLFMGTLATLFVLPAVFAMGRRHASVRTRSLDPDDPISAHFVGAAEKESTLSSSLRVRT